MQWHTEKNILLRFLSKNIAFPLLLSYFLYLCVRYLGLPTAVKHVLH